MGDERTQGGGGQGEGWGTPPPPGEGWGTPPPPGEGWGTPPPPGGPPQQPGWGQSPGAPQQPGWGQGPPPGGPPQQPGQPGQPGWQQYPGWQPPGGPARPSTNGVAVAALVCGLLSVPLVVFLVGGFLGVVAVILGAVGLSRVRVTGTGRGMAIAGIVTGGLAVLLTAGLVALGVQVFQDPEFQEFLEEIEEEQRRQEQLREDDAGQD